MIRGMLVLVVSLLGLGACEVEHYEDCSRIDDDFFDDDFDWGHRAGSSAQAGRAPRNESGTGGTDATAGSSATEGGSAGDSSRPEPAVPCDKERDCGPGFNCNFEVHQCQAAEAETCGEMENETECAARNDCIAVYGGINCSCGADCECQGGEPGCICERFDYLVCQPAQ